MDDSMHQRGVILTAIATAPVMQWEEEREKAYVDQIPTPTTLSSVDDISAPRKRRPEHSDEETPPRKRIR